MIDKLELRLPRMTLFQPRVREFILESRHFENSTRTMGSGRYSWVTDLRPIGMDALLHYSLKRDEHDPHEGEHKLELLDTGTKGYSALVEQIESTIEGSILDLEIMRIDLCADMFGIPIDWFFSRLRVKFKRVGHEIGTLKAQRIGKVGIQTLSAGKRPNIFRAYDKVAEYNEQLRKLRRKRSRDADEITLESEFGISENATITRLEQQFGGNRIPIQIDSFALLRNLPGFNPFARIEISRGTGAGVPTISECGLDEWLSGTRLRQLQEEMGQQQFCRWITEHSGGNSARWRKKYAPFLEPENDFPVTSETVFQTYRESVVKQLAA
ncbi:MAG TPA: hypothetical protein VHX20_06770 [Terracidiphilus sp.]|jgi:hypothetical protein|nr:hypothetical protein [Terracidiphilus sp.]